MGQPGFINGPIVKLVGMYVQVYNGTLGLLWKNKKSDLVLQPDMDDAAFPDYEFAPRRLKTVAFLKYSLTSLGTLAFPDFELYGKSTTYLIC